MPSSLISRINSILEHFAKTYDAELTTIQTLEWKDQPESLRLAKYADTDWAPLYETAKTIDLLIINHPSLEDDKSCFYVNKAREFFRELSRSNATLDCKCGGTLKMKINKTTGMGFYSCSNWVTGCKETRNLLGESSSLSKKLTAKAVGRKCPTCSKELLVRLAKVGKMAGKEFVGCSGFPSCSYTEKV